MIIYKIIRKEYPIWVRKFKIEELDPNLCSPKFRNYIENYTPPSETFVKCNEDGSLNMRLRKKGRKEYRIYDIMKHENIVEQKEIRND